MIRHPRRSTQTYTLFPYTTLDRSPVEKSIYNPHAIQTPATPSQVMAGSIIAACLVTGLNSDLPGLVVAQVTENVYDSVTGRTLLIPQGARLIEIGSAPVLTPVTHAHLVCRLLLEQKNTFNTD